MPEARSPAARLVVAAGLAGAVWSVVQLVLARYVPAEEVAYLLAALAVLVSASVAGMRAGVLTTLLLAPAAFFAWARPEPNSPWNGRLQDTAEMALFVVVGVAISTLAGREAAAKRAARASEERFRRMFEQAPLGTTIVDHDYRLLGVNRRFCEMLGYTERELVGRTIASLTYPPDTPEDARLAAQMWSEETPGYRRVKQYVRKDGTMFWADVSVAAMRDVTGRQRFAVGMVQDITERKRMEESLERARADADAARERAEEASRAKDQFIAVLSHELRTPLSPVLLTASSLEADASLPAAVRDGIHTIRQNVELEARLIDDLLDVTGIARGKLSLRRGRVDANVLIGQALYMVERDATEKGLRVRAELGAPCIELDADPTRVEQVFWNLLKNAVKFTPAGGDVVVRTACEWSPVPVAPGAPPGWMVAEVSDTGAGIEADVLPTLFRPFEQGRSSLARQFGGLGLGLAIARSIVEMHGGRIDVASEGAGRGTTFTVRLPLAAAGTPAAEAPETAPAARGATPAPGRMRILLVEDHPATRRAMAAILTSLGHEVRAAASLAEALALAEGGEEGARFDLVVSDLALPDGSGHDLMRRLKERRRDLHGVAVSGFGMDDDVRRSREAGFDEHLTKPVSRERIQEALSHIGV